MLKQIAKSVWQPVLRWFYRKKEIYLKQVSFSEKEQMLHGQCYVPSKGSYGKMPIKYVTAENFVRCLSQLAYIIMFLLKKTRVGHLTEITSGQFKEWMTNHWMYYHLIKMKFSKTTLKDAPFELILRVGKTFNRGNFIGCYLNFSGAIQGQMQILAVNKPAISTTVTGNRFLNFMAYSWSAAVIIFGLYLTITNNWQALDKLYLASY